MNHSQSLPEPSSDALNHSNKLAKVIRDEIASSETQSITFRRYMEMALYQPKMGYYVAGSFKIGKEGDFTTAPEISPLFSRCIANQCAEVLIKIRSSRKDEVQACILELGAGSGAMASEILLVLEQQNQLPERYYIIDISPDLIFRQQQTLQQRAPHLIDLVEWVSKLPSNFVGVVLGNEVLDAMPVDVFTQHGNTIYEHHVVCEEETLAEQLRPAKEQLQQRVSQLNIQSDAPYTSELNPNLKGWMQSLSQCLDQGVILLIDYGYPNSEYYLSERNKGTLICHYQHLVNTAPLMYPGLQDITANVDFTAVAEEADNSGFHVAGFTSQAHFLSNAGLEKYFMQALEDDKNNEQNQYQLAQQIRTLSMPSEMGERFKCIGLSKKYDQSLLGFSNYDQRIRL